MAPEEITALYALTPGYFQYIPLSIATLPEAMPVVVSYAGTAELPAGLAPRARIVRPRESSVDNFRKSYTVNVGIRSVTTKWVLLSDADFLYPESLLDVLKNECDIMTIRRFFLGRCTPEFSEEIMGGGVRWTRFKHYSGRLRYRPPRLLERCVSKAVRTLFSRLDVTYGRGWVDFHEIYGNPNPCVYSMELLSTLHGYDENFVGWGGEDDDLALRAGRLGAREERLPLIVGHLHHPRIMDFPNYYSDSNRMEILGKERPAVANPSGWGDGPA